MKEINSFQEFKDMLVAIGNLSTFNQNVSSFINLVSGLSGGCGCNKRQRVDAARNLYLRMPALLTEGEKTEIKGRLGVENVKLSDGGGVFSIF